MDSHRSSNDPDHPPSRDHPPRQIQRLTRQRHDLVAPRQPSTARRPRVLHVPSEYESNDQSSWILTSCW